MPAESPVELNPGRPRVRLVVRNTGDRPVQVGSHYHFAAANPALEFDRDAARGHRLDVPAGTSVRFEPGVEREVSLVPLAGRAVVPGLRFVSVPPTSGTVTSGERDASRPHVRDRAEHSPPQSTSGVDSGEAGR